MAEHISCWADVRGNSVSMPLVPSPFAPRCRSWFVCRKRRGARRRRCAPENAVVAAREEHSGPFARHEHRAGRIGSRDHLDRRGVALVDARHWCPGLPNNQRLAMGDAHRALHALEYLSAALVSWTIALCCFVYAWRLVCTKVRVMNVSDPAVFEARSLAGFIRQSEEAPSLLAFRTEVAALIKPNMSNLETAIAIRHWCRSQQTGDWGTIDISSEDPRLLLDRQRIGISGACRRFAYVFAGALLAAGLDCRVVTVSPSLYKSNSSHTIVEVWISELHKWVLMDSMFDAMFLVDGAPASLLEVHEGLTGGDPGRITFERNGAVSEPTSKIDRDYIEMFEHLFYSMTNAFFDGYQVKLFRSRRIAFAHYVRLGGEPYPEAAKQTSIWLSIILATVGLFCAAHWLWL
jgi:transglutaminase superfamily protein